MIDTPIVFLPGWGFSAAIWKPCADKFKNSVLLELPDFSTIETMCNELHQRMPTNCTLVAWSLSGLLAIYYGFHFQHIKNLILVASTPYFMQDQQWPGISTQFAEAARTHMLTDFNSYRKYFLKLVQYPSRIDLALDHYFAQTPSHDLSAYLSFLFTTDFREVYKQLSVPITIILGEKDSIVPAAISEHLTAPNIQINIIENAGHAPFLTHEKLFLNAMG